jgi:sigma-B regulation protein RsbU (phosphoserine phosphatase)
VFSSEGQWRELPADKNGMIVGILDSARYQTASHTIAPGEGLLIFTDGVTEAMDRQEEFFGEARLEALLERDGALPAEKLVAQVMTAVDEFADGTPQADDITVMAMRYLGN